MKKADKKVVSVRLTRQQFRDIAAAAQRSGAFTTTYMHDAAMEAAGPPSRITISSKSDNLVVSAYERKEGPTR